MNIEYIEMYNSMCQQLQEKYGLPKYEYICKQGYNDISGSNYRISRTSEGLVIHHIGELYYRGLQQMDQYGKGRKWQQPNKLCYCRAEEHFKLHYLIMLSNTREDNCFGALCGIVENYIEGSKLYPRYMWMKNFYMYADRDKMNMCIEFLRKNKDQISQKWLNNQNIQSILK